MIVIESWPVLKAVRKEAGGMLWRTFQPIFRMVRPYRRAATKRTTPFQLELSFAPEVSSMPKMTLADQRKRAFDGFRFSLPKEVAKRTERFGSHKWQLLQMFRERTESMELASQNPALAYCLANANLFRNLVIADTATLAASISKNKQRDIAGWLGFPDTEAAARILSRIIPEAVQPATMRRFATALREETACRALAHLPRINAGVIGLVIDAELLARVSPKLLNEVAVSVEDKYRAHTAGLVSDTLAMASQLRRVAAARNFHSVKRLREIHREFSVEFCQLKPDEFSGSRFPRPPLPGTLNIIPLRAPTDLVQEGQEQTNCVATYIPSVVAGEIYIYRVLQPERATLSISLGPDGAWEIDQLLLSGNRSVNAATRARVESWLDGFLQSA